MIRSLSLRNFTVFRGVSETLVFGDINVFHGENSAGKTHLLKLLYASTYVVASPTVGDERPVRSRLNRSMAEKLIGVFKPDKLGNLVTHGAREPADVAVRFSAPNADFHFKIGNRASAEVDVEQVPPDWRDQIPVYLPPRELLSLQPEFVGLGTELHLPFDETWLDTSRLLNRPLARGQKGKDWSEMLGAIEHAMGGQLVTDKAGRFKLKVSKNNEVEMHLVAEGLRKLATLARLFDNKALRDKGALYWDEPEANLNPRLVRALVPILLGIARTGTQVFIATHSLFLLRELYIYQQTSSGAPVGIRYFGLQRDEAGSVAVRQSGDLDDTGDIAALDENLAQSQRYLAAEP